MQAVHGGGNNALVQAQQIDGHQEDVLALIPLQLEHVEEVIINPDGFDQQLNQEVIQNQEEHVIAMDELTNIDSKVEIQHVALPIPPVEIVPFPDFNNLQPMIPLAGEDI